MGRRAEWPAGRSIKRTPRPSCPASTHCPISDQQHPHDQANPRIWIPLVNTRLCQWLSQKLPCKCPQTQRFGWGSLLWARCVCTFPHESELNTHLGMKAVASSSKNKLPVKSDVPLLSERKGARAGCAAQESGVPTAHQAARARPCGCSGNTWAGAGPCIADMLKRSLEN